MTSKLRLSLAEIDALSMQVLQAHGLPATHAAAISRIIVAGQRDECHSHGVYRLLNCVRTLRSGKVHANARPAIHAVNGAVVRVDADMGFSPLAFETGLPMLIEKARQHGLAALAINRCVHFSALWPEIEMLTAQGLVALAMTPSHAWVAPAGGVEPVFGTNPIAFGWPRPGPYPYVFDFATSAVARGEIELHRRQGLPIPPDWGVAPDGQPSTDPAAVLAGAMRTFGGYKGSALATMIELMAGSLVGDWTSRQSMDFDAGAGASPCHGELVLAFDPASFGNAAANLKNAEALFDAITSQGARLPSARRYAARERSLREGVELPRTLYEEILALLPAT